MYLTTEPALIHSGTALAFSAVCVAAIAFMSWFFFALVREERRGSSRCNVHFVTKTGIARQGDRRTPGFQPGAREVARAKMAIALPGIEGISAGTVLISLHMNHGLGEREAGLL
jgi:hypothetical protein